MNVEEEALQRRALRPAGFQFLSQDVFEISPVVKHNMPFLPFVEGALVEIKTKASCCPSPSSLPSSRDSNSDMPVCCAVYQESNVSRYIQQVQRDRPALLLLLAERSGRALGWPPTRACSGPTGTRTSTGDASWSKRCGT